MDIHNKTVNKYYKNYKWYEVKELKFNLYGLFPYFKTIRKIFNNTFAELNKYKKIIYLYQNYFYLIIHLIH